MKTAAAQLRALLSELEKYQEKEKRAELAQDILTKTSSDISAEDFLIKLSEYSKKSLEELIVIQKAVELHKNGELSLGKLSVNKADSSSLDPLTALLIEEY